MARRAVPDPLAPGALSETPIRDAIGKIGDPRDDIEDETVTLTVDADSRDVGVTLEADKDFGKPGGWSGGIAGGWRKSIGGFVQAIVQWRGKASE